MDGGDQDQMMDDQGCSLKIGVTHVHKSTNKIVVDFPYKTKVTKPFLLICKIEKRLYVYTLSGLEE